MITRDDTTAALSAPGSAFEIVEEEVRGVRMPVFRHRARSLRELLERTAAFGERTYLVDGTVRLDFRTHLELVDALAVALQEDFAVRPGDRVAIFAANRWEWVVAFWAVTTAGGVPAAYNGFWTADEVAHATALVEPVLLIGDGPRLERVRGIDGLPAVLDLDGIGPLVEAHRGDVPAAVAVDEDDPGVLLFTSGTTGRPKAVATPHRALVGFGQVNSSREALARVHAGGAAPRVGEPLPLSDDIVLVTSPLFHRRGRILRRAAARALRSGTRPRRHHA